MIEVRGNLWTYPADVRVITTNGTVKKNGEAVMGRGCAAEAKRMYPRLPRELGRHIRHLGNIVMDYGLTDDGNYLMTFPVKHEWMQKADQRLIEVSARTLTAYINSPDWHTEFKTVVLPRPGCGNGGLQWCWHNDLNEDKECYGVRHVLEPILDDRFHVITYA